MKIVSVAHGWMPIPPKAWGAVESTLWNYKLLIEPLGHEFHIVNTRDFDEIEARVRALKPDFVHVRCERWFDLLERLQAPVKIISTHDGEIWSPSPEARANRRHVYEQGFVRGTFAIHCLSERIRDYFLSLGVDDRRMFVVPNGANGRLFRWTEAPPVISRSICLAQIHKRKRQTLLLGYPDLDFVGPIRDSDFPKRDPRYLGEWTKDEVHKRLTDYSNLVLLSESEGAPLVAYEAMMAGLGLVLSENAADNLDSSRPFITIIEESRTSDADHVAGRISENAVISRQMRREIRQYAIEHFDVRRFVDLYLGHLTRLLAEAA